MKPSKTKSKRAKRANCLHANSQPLKNHPHLLPPPPPAPDVDVGTGVGLMHATLDEAERAIGYSFRDQSLLVEALTHSSYPGRASYQRLEFVGDAALNLAFTNYLYSTNPHLGPGELSSLRAANISTEKLARAAVRLGLYRLVLRNAQELDRMVEEFTSAVIRERGDEIGRVSYGGSSMKAPKVLADIVESTAAAVYIDCGFDLDTLWKVFRNILAPIVTLKNLDGQPVTTLYEQCQKKGKSVQLKSSSKGSRYNIKVFVDRKLVGSGSAEQKYIAKLNAARDALQNLSSSDEEEEEEESTDSTMEMEAEEEECCCLQSPPVAAAARVEEAKEGAKKILNELCSKRHWPNPMYRIVRMQGPAHDRRFTCSVEVASSGGRLSAVGDAKPRVKDAENDAASKMLSKLN